MSPTGAPQVAVFREKIATGGAGYLGSFRRTRVTILGTDPRGASSVRALGRARRLLWRAVHEASPQSAARVHPHRIDDRRRDHRHPRGRRDPGLHGLHEALEEDRGVASAPVSYTHLTLPTSDL